MNITSGNGIIPSSVLFESYQFKLLILSSKCVVRFKQLSYCLFSNLLLLFVFSFNFEELLEINRFNCSIAVCGPQVFKETV